MKKLLSEITDWLNKVPEITIFFWIIKILCTTVWETFADWLNFNIGIWLTGTTAIMTVLLLIALFFQFKTAKYKPSIYRLVVVLISVVWTLIIDNLTDNLGIPLVITTIVFSIILLTTFVIWYRQEGTLSIHSITMPRRELFYWWAILCTFALGTAAGDLVAEWLGLWYLFSAIIFVWMIMLIYLWYRYLNRSVVTTFWIAYIMTRPLGASIGDLLSQSSSNGWRWLGTTGTSILFLVTIVWLIRYLSKQQHNALL